MPFSSLNDPADLARAYASLERVWNEVKGTVAEGDQAKERERIACMVVAFAPLALDEDDLTQNVLFHLERDVAALAREAPSAPAAGLSSFGSAVLDPI